MLEVRQLSVFYGQHAALREVSIIAQRREIVAILGANGAGKSTLLKTIAGVVRPRHGHIDYRGNDLTRRVPHEIVQMGIAFVPQGRAIFGDLTVAENLSLGAYAERARNAEEENRRRVLSLFPRLSERQRQTALTMSGGEQQMLAIGRALMSAPELLLLDEPSHGLAPLLCTELFQSLQRIRAAGVGILLVEQNVKQSLAIADRGYVVETGHIVGEGRAEELVSNPTIRRAYLGLTLPRPDSLPSGPAAP